VYKEKALIHERDSPISQLFYLGLLGVKTLRDTFEDLSPGIYQKLRQQSIDAISCGFNGTVILFH
jgi:hypothetical protein